MPIMIWETFSIFCSFMYGFIAILCFLKAFHELIILKTGPRDGDYFVFILLITYIIFTLLQGWINEYTEIKIPAAFNFYAAITGIVLSVVYWIVDGDRWKK